jgi:hypothetical protein
MYAGGMKLIESHAPSDFQAGSFPTDYARRGVLLRQLDEMGWPRTPDALAARQGIIAQIAGCTRAMRRFDAVCRAS